MIYPSPRKHSPGLTLIEMLIAVSIISVAFLGFMAAFGSIAASIQQSKMHTLASNLAQEKMQILKQVSYYRLMITTTTAYNTAFTPAVAYDTGYYPPETVYEGGITYQRLTHVQMAAEIDGKIELMGAVQDTGMKAVTVSVIWQQGSKPRLLQVTSVKANPNTVMANSVFNGVVKNALTNLPIPNANVTIAENMGWQDTSDTDGKYRITTYPGNYSLIASARGYFSQNIFQAIAPSQTMTQNFSLVPKSSGTVYGTAWLNNHLVISQIVASTVTLEGADQEFIELYNPTPEAIQFGSSYSLPVIRVMYQGEDGSSPSAIPLTFAAVNPTIAPKSYYLIANTNTVTACGATRTADAVYETPGQDIIKTPDAGFVGLQNSAGTWIDVVGWNRSGGGKTAPRYEGSPIPQSAGFTRSEQYVRRSSTAGYNAGFGRAYDAANNSIDMLDIVSMFIPPRSSADTEPAIVATPAFGAVVTATDDLSLPKTAVSKGSVPYAEFELPEVATGTWTVMIASGSQTIEISPVAVLSNGERVGIPNNSTDPLWPATGRYAAFLTSTTTSGYITGRILNAAGAPISPAVKVTCDLVDAYADTSSGKYVLAVASGTYSVTANPGNKNAGYVEQKREPVVVQTGQVTSDVDFYLSMGGQVRGWVTRDKINPLPGVSIVAFDQYGVPGGETISGTDGKFLIINLSTGPYTVQPVLDSGENSNPETADVTVTGGSSVFVATFTVAGAFGKITGSVFENGKPISTGVLILASTGTITAPPPAMNSAASTMRSVYSTNSYENGTYSLDVRGSTVTAYNVYAYYPKINGSAVTIRSGSCTSVPVAPGQRKEGINFSW